MFEARLVQGNLLKRLADALKELVTEVNFDVTSSGLKMQAMDHSHVCLVAMELASDGFEHYRCDRPMSMGINVQNLLKVLKCAGNEDVVTLKADDNGDTLTLIFESKKQDKVWDFDLKLLSIDSETLDVPAQDPDATIRMPSSEYQRICRDLSSIGETVAVSVIKHAAKLSVAGDVGTANVMLRHSTTGEAGSDDIQVDMYRPVSLTFALRYLNNFAKLHLTDMLPMVVKFVLPDDRGMLQFFLAPKIDDGDEDGDDGA